MSQYIYRSKMNQECSPFSNQCMESHTKDRIHHSPPTYHHFQPKESHNLGSKCLLPQPNPSLPTPPSLSSLLFSRLLIPPSLLSSLLPPSPYSFFLPTPLFSSLPTPHSPFSSVLPTSPSPSSFAVLTAPSLSSFALPTASFLPTPPSLSSSALPTAPFLSFLLH